MFLDFRRFAAIYCLTKYFCNDKEQIISEPSIPRIQFITFYFEYNSWRNLWKNHEGNSKVIAEFNFLNNLDRFTLSSRIWCQVLFSPLSLSLSACCIGHVIEVFNSIALWRTFSLTGECSNYWLTLKAPIIVVGASSRVFVHWPPEKSFLI